jgi:poly(A) polymerase
MVMIVEPQVIPRKEHRISRKAISPNAVRTLYRLHFNGFIAHLVGGCVRDLMLGRKPKDFDIATNATPGQIKRLFRNCRLIGRRFRLAHLHYQDEIIEVSTFRREALPSDMEEEIEVPIDGRPKRPRHVKDEEGMVLVDNLFGTPEEDALRRDFTVNALAYNIADFSIIDYTGGIGDLHLRTIRLIGDPQKRFTEDPVRMLRAVRFAASHDFDIEPGAWETLCELSQTINRASPARLYEEIQKLFLMGSAHPAFVLLEKSGLLDVLFPSLIRWAYGNNRHMQLVNGNLEALDGFIRGGIPMSAALMFAAIFGQSLDDGAYARHRQGTPRHQALDEVCAAFMQEVSPVVSMPNKVINRMRAILGLQYSLTRMPPKRVASVAARAEFVEALIYLKILGDTKKDLKKSADWWDEYLLNAPPVEAVDTVDTASEERPRKRKRKRRYRKRGPRKVPVE